jgi:hypothetical protein
MEVRVPALPNLDEALVRAGTPLNERFQKKETAASLGPGHDDTGWTYM